jgi:hypothetical protein
VPASLVFWDLVSRSLDGGCGRVGKQRLPLFALTCG